MNKLREWWYMFECWALSHRCALEGHQWVDTSFRSPDSGTEGGYCERCGYSFEHTYY